MPKYLTNITILATPTEPEHAVTLAVVEAAIGEHYKGAVRAASGVNLDGAYASKALVGSGALPVVDGVSLSVGDRLLLAGQSDLTQNGIYVVSQIAAPWKLTRSADFNTSDQIKAGVKVHVNQGTSFADVTFALVNDGPFTLDTTPLEFELAGGLMAAMVQKDFAVVGDGSETVFVFTHGWGTRLVTAELIDETDWATILADVSRPSDNAVSVSFAAPPPSGKRYSVIVRAWVKP